MTTNAGFAQTDMTPPKGTKKTGWLLDIASDHVIDPLYARIGVIDSGGDSVAFVGLDTLSIRWTHTSDIRRRIEKEYGFPGDHIMVAASHNHAGGAVASVGDVKRDDAYVETVTRHVVAAFGEALADLRKAELGFASAYEWDVAANRRVVMRDGTVRTFGSFDDGEALCLEGPIDPEVAVTAVRTPQGAPVGCIVNFACHPTHHGGGAGLSAGYPGVLAREMRTRGWPVTVFLNGACGNVHTIDPRRSGADPGMEEAGMRLAADVTAALAEMRFKKEVAVRSSTVHVDLPYRTISDDDLRGTTRGAQRLSNSTGVYDRLMPAAVKRVKERGTQPAEVQVISLDEYDFVGIPGEYFVEHGLRIKEEAYPRHAMVVSCANGMVGYLPTRNAFKRGGYETTFTLSSRLAPEAGDILADAAIALIRR